MTTIRSALLAVLAATGFVSAPSQASELPDQGLTETTVRIGLFGPLSGAAKAHGLDVINAAKMYYDKVNKAGGVHGRQIELVIEDDRCDEGDLLAAVEKLTQQDQVFLLNGGSCSGPLASARDYVEQAKVPLVMLNAPGDSVLYPPSKYIFGAFAMSQRAIGGSVVQFAAEHLKGKTIGYINHDDAYGAWNLESAARQAKVLGVNLQVQSVNPNMTDAIAPILKARLGNPDALVITTYAQPVSLLLRKAHELNFDKPIVVAVNGTANWRQMVREVGDSAAFSKVYLQEVMRDAPGGAKLRWVYDMYRDAYPDLAARPGHPQPQMPYGLASAMTVVKALEAAGPNLTRENFLEALARTKFDSEVMAGPIELTATDHGAQKSAMYLTFYRTQLVAVPGLYRGTWTDAP